MVLGTVVGPDLAMAMLQTPGQERALMPGGWLVGKVAVAIIQPFFAMPQYSEGYTLADMKAANPGTVFLAYANGAICHMAEPSLGPLDTAVDAAEAESKGWLIPCPNPSVWPDKLVAPSPRAAGKSQKDTSLKYIRYDDYPNYYLARIDSDDYRRAFARHCLDVMAYSSKSSHGAPNGQFDGVFLDDTNMGPQHGLDLDDTGGAPADGHAPEPYGPWRSNDDYGKTMISFVQDVAGQVRDEAGEASVIAVNLGADPIWAGQRALSLELAASRRGGRPTVDRFLREYSTAWYGGYSWIDAQRVKGYIDQALDITTNGVFVDFSDHAKPPADPKKGPTTAERSAWDAQQRLVNAVALLGRTSGGPITTAQAIQVPTGRNQWGSKDLAEDMGDKVANLDIDRNVVFGNSSTTNFPTGALAKTGDVLHRTYSTGTLYANFSGEDRTVDGVLVPKRDVYFARSSDSE
ncbi:hypothetical protein [Kocuria massiliensis]|uniref:hypothetical protein n=1 Tax=Kocuria massiliensis TaxID=1926282 RepID=UPI0022B94686|nr:hypothetical protein [Kocuria massiliensis]